MATYSIAEKILLLLAGGLDLWKLGNDIYFKRADIFDLLDEKPGSAETTMIRLLSAKDIQKIIKNGEAYFQITSQGWERLKKRININRKNEKSDGIWRILIFDIPEKRRVKRDILRNKLERIGFGQLQKSVWVSPFPLIRPLNDFLKFHNLDNGVIQFEAKSIGEMTNQEIASLAWPLDKLQEDYNTLIKRLESAKDASPSARKTYQDRYLEILERDPCLPKELLPRPWFGHKARKIFDYLSNKPRNK